MCGLEIVWYLRGLWLLYGVCVIYWVSTDLGVLHNSYLYYINTLLNSSMKGHLCS